MPNLANKLIAYVVMPDFHLIVNPKDGRIRTLLEGSHEQ
jgi:hypothetical protein